MMRKSEKNFMSDNKKNRNWSIYSILFLISFGIVFSCNQTENVKSIFEKENLVAWCIVPFDSKNRSPDERAMMLNELGITSIAWDWRSKHLPLFEYEIEILRKSNIELKSVWFYVNASSENVIDNECEMILQSLEKTKTQTDLWVSFPESFFEGLSEEEKIKKGASTIGYINNRARKMNCTISLYNHGGWFGTPENMVKIIKAMNSTEIGLVYNFHHAHSQSTNFEKNINLMLPYLTTVNLNGMRKNGPKILPLGDGNMELEMMKTLKDSGFSGSIGILGHKDDEDVKISLQKNLDGMKKLLEQMGDESTLKSYN
jgi:hypothetical protein